MPSKSVFDLTHERKLSGNMGDLIPIACVPIIPGDEFAWKTDMLVRLAPMLAPMMHRVNVYTHAFFVPNRTVMTDWESFITGGPDGTDATVFPTIESPAGTGFLIKSLADHLGLPTGVPGRDVSALPFRAYAKIFNDWFRDQNLIDPVAMSMGSGADTTTNTAVLKRAWEKDYFTSMLPFAQRGDPAQINLGGEAEVTRVSNAPNAMRMMRVGTNTAEGAGTVSTQADGDLVSSNAPELNFDPRGSLVADLSSATPITVNAFRQVLTLQHWLEKSARGGARYVETILEHFGIRSSDARLQRAEYLGGGKSPVVVSEVLQTSATDSGTPLGAMAGHGFSTPEVHEWKKTFEEHGYVIVLLSVLPRTAYQQGIPRHWSYASRFDFPWPTFAGLGEQGVKKKELYAASADPEGILGYAPRYDECRTIESSVHGDFRDTLDYWHMGRIFESEPTLSDVFVTSDPTKRIFAAEDEDGLWIQILNQVQAKRCLPLVAKPGVMTV